MKQIYLAVWLAFFASPNNAQQAAQRGTQKEPMSHQAQFFQQTTNGAIFIYAPQVDPCAPLPPGVRLAPLGTGFVVGIANKTESRPDRWRGWKFLITAKHVISNQTEIIIRLNAANESKFVCQRLQLQLQGATQNVASAPSGTDLVAIALPDISGTDPTVIPSSLLTDEAKMKEFSIGVGTEVLTVGYLLGYSGQKVNFPMAKFGHISVMTDELWYLNPGNGLMEQGYVVDMSNAPGLSGAPVFAHGIEFETNPFRYRELPPFIVGVVKGLMLAPAGNQMISFGTTIVEPGANLKALIKEIARTSKLQGADVEDIN
jgi:hypothetical protein